MSLSLLPSEILLEIFQYLPMLQQAVLGSVSRRFHEVYWLDRRFLGLPVGVSLEQVVLPYL
jgi:hypothetical protein